MFFGALTIAIVLISILQISILITIIFLERKNPTAALAWLLTVMLVPFGIFIYLIFSQNIARHKIFKVSKKEKKYVEKSVEEQLRELDKIKEEQGDINYIDIIHMHLTHSNAPFKKHNDVTIYYEGNEKFDSLINDINNAKESINLGYFIFKKDELSNRLMTHLIMAAERGVDVRVLVDGLGSKLDKTLVKELQSHGAKVAEFFPSKIKIINFKSNYRNHRKIVVIDDEIGYVGGFNVGNEYLGDGPLGYWRDTHLRIYGESAMDLNHRFLLDWRFATQDDVKLLPNTKDFSDIPFCGIQIVSSGPDSIYEQIKYGYMKLINSAKDYIYIQTPYFIPDDPFFEALELAVLSGVDVHIMIPAKPDHKFVYWATYSYIGMILKTGAKIHLYDKGFLHAKTMIIDDKVTTVGTANFDIRSFRLNFEVNAFIYNEEKAKEMATIFRKDVKDSHILTIEDYEKRGKGIKFKESVTRLVSPIL